MTNATDVVDAVAKMRFHCQVEGYHHAYSDQAKRGARLYVDRLCVEILTLNERDRRTMLSQIGGVAAWQLRSIQSRECAVKLVEGKTGIPSVLYKYIPMDRIGKGAPRSLRATQPSALNDDMECSIGPMGGTGADASRYRAAVGAKLQEYLGVTMSKGEVAKLWVTSIRAARFPAVKSLDTFDFLAIPSVNKALVVELARCEYIERRENAIAVGNSGTGKTHIALGLGLAACQRGMSVGFTTAASLVHELMEARDERRLLNLQRQLSRLNLLIIDELGFVPLSPTGAELLFEVFSQRYERGSILVTTNLPFDEWTEVFGSERLTGALLDRLTHHVHILEMNGDSYRLKGSRENAVSPSPDYSDDV